MFESYAMQPQMLLLANHIATLCVPAGLSSSALTGLTTPPSSRDTANETGALPSKLAYPDAPHTSLPPDEPRQSGRRSSAYVIRTGEPASNEPVTLSLQSLPNVSVGSLPSALPPPVALGSIVESAAQPASEAVAKSNEAKALRIMAGPNCEGRASCIVENSMTYRVVGGYRAGHPSSGSATATQRAQAPAIWVIQSRIKATPSSWTRLRPS